MSDAPLKKYAAPGITVTFDATRCIHSARCLRALPGVFDVNDRPWVKPDRAAADEVAKAVEGCPSGALRYERHDGGPAEVPEPKVFAVAMPNGPLVLRGVFGVVTSKGEELDPGPRATLCRCGQSGNKPFCDNTHRKIGFKDPA